MGESPPRRYLRLDLGSLRPPPRTPVATRVITDERFPSIAELMVEAYTATIDFEDDTVDDALRELSVAAAGEYGEPLRQHWLEVVRDDGSPCAAIICTRLSGIPFVSFTFTSHRDTRRGLATTLVADVATALRDEGETALSLGVTVGNPAERIYERLGFRDAERKPPGTA